MSKQILVNSSPYETRVATLEDGEIKQLHIEREEDRNVVGNIYKGQVKRVLPGMQAAFLELGLERTAFLYVDDIIDEPFGTDVDYVDNESEGDEDSDDSDTDNEETPESETDETPTADSKPATADGEEASAEATARPTKKEAKPRRASRKTAPRGRRGRPPRREKRNVEIQTLLKEGQEILVQVAKAPIGTKGARLTTHISLPGRNLVLMPTVKHLGISRRIESDRERRRLRDIFTKKIRPKGVGFIIRTVAAGKSFKELKADADYLLKLWERIQSTTGTTKAPAIIHEDLSLALKSARDSFTDEVESLVIDNPRDYDEVSDFINQFSPRLKGRIKLFRGPSQLFEHYGIEAEISRALGKKVWLKSGGYLLIDQSEALTAIDVNTGRYVGSSNSLEETIFRTNLEAVKEIAYQLRIRNVGGIIIIDLIDMENSHNKRKVYDSLQEVLSEDKARTNILKISELGLVEMTRKRTHEDLIRYLTEGCGYCEGRGYHKSRRTLCFEIFREIEKESIQNDLKTVVVFANPEVAKRMTTEESKHVRYLEERFEKSILVKHDPAFHVEQYEVFSKP